MPQDAATSTATASVSATAIRRGVRKVQHKSQKLAAEPVGVVLNYDSRKPSRAWQVHSKNRFSKVENVL